jgi:hypothetical protein
MSQPLLVSIPECRLDASALGPQISRYQRLAEPVIGIERNPGEVRVQFDEDVPDGLLRHTLAAERDCCALVGIEYEPTARTLTSP